MEKMFTKRGENVRKVLYTSLGDDAYLISHLGTGVNVKAHVVVGQLGGLFLQLPGESDLPVAGNTDTTFQTQTTSFQIPCFRLLLLLFTIMAHFRTSGQCMHFKFQVVHNYMQFI